MSDEQRRESPREQLRREWAQWDELSKQWRKEFNEWLYGTPTEQTGSATPRGNGCNE